MVSTLGPTRTLLHGPVRLVGEDPSLGGGTAAAFLTSAAFPFRPGGIPGDLLLGLDLVEEPVEGELAVPALVSRFLTLHGNSGRAVDQQNAGRDLVDVLPAVASRTDKCLLEVLLPDSEPTKSFDP